MSRIVMIIKSRMIFISLFLVAAMANSEESNGENYKDYKEFNPSIADEHPVEFIRRFAIFMQTYDEGLIDLYSDDAKIVFYHKTENSLEKYSELTGEEWKKIARRAIWLARNTEDKVTLSNVDIVTIDGGFRIGADRYSVKTCYTDTSFYLVVKFNAEGKLKIVEEYLEKDSSVKC